MCYPLLCRGLADNAEPERFPMRHEVGGKPFPCRYLKLVPLQSWGPMFAYSVWYLELQGVTDQVRVSQAQQWLSQVSSGMIARLPP